MKHANPKHSTHRRSIERQLKHGQYYRHRLSYAMPYVLWDADVLRELFSAENYTQTHHPDHNFTPSQMLDMLSQRGKSTIIIPRKVLNEVLRYAHTDASGAATGGSYDFYITPDNTLDFCTETQGLVFPETVALAEYLSAARAKGALRCYDSMAQMARAGEMGRSPKGGIVIVDTDYPRDQLPPSKKGVTFLTLNFTDSSGQQQGYQATHMQRHAGDKALAALSRYLYARAKHTGTQGALMVISNDVGCKQLIGQACEPHTGQGRFSPSQIGLSSLIHTLEYTGLMPIESNQAMVECIMKPRAGNNRTITQLRRASYSENSPTYMNQCLNWLEAARIVPRQQHMTR